MTATITPVWSDLHSDAAKPESLPDFFFYKWGDESAITVGALLKSLDAGEMFGLSKKTLKEIRKTIAQLQADYPELAETNDANGETLNPDAPIPFEPVNGQTIRVTTIEHTAAPEETAPGVFPEIETIAPEVEQIIDKATEGKRIVCKNCDGRGCVGYDIGAPQDCPVCHGAGTVLQIDPAKELADEIVNAAIVSVRVDESIWKAEKRIQACEEIEESRHEDYKDAKKDTESAIEHLRKLVRESREPHPNALPFDNPERVNPPESNSSETPNSSPASPSDIWRSFPLVRWAEREWLPKHIVTKLAAHGSGINTVGDLSDYMQPAANGWVKPLTDIEKIGKGAAEKIEQANESFWGWWKAGGEREYIVELAEADGSKVVGYTQIPADVVNDIKADIEAQKFEQANPEFSDDWQEPAPGQRAEAS